MSCIAGGFLPSEPQGSPLWWKSPGGHRKPNIAPEAYARVGKLSFVGCRRGRGKSHPRTVQLSLDLFRSGPQDWSPGSRYLWALWHLWSVEGTEVAPFPWGQGSYPRKKCQLQRLQEKPVLLSPERSAVNPKGCGSSPPTQGRWGGILQTKEAPFFQENIRKCSGEPACKSTGVRYKGAAERAGPRGLKASIILESPEY